MNGRLLYVFFGYWSEYTLNPLYLYMLEHGFDCIEITPTSTKNIDKSIRELAGRDIVLITSAHMFLDKTYQQYLGHDDFLSPLEVMDILKPKKSVHYPHDLATLLHEYDQPWIPSLFDVTLWPLPCMAHLTGIGSRVYSVGWIKKMYATPIGNHLKAVHAFSDIIHYDRLGISNTYEIFRPLWDRGISVKMPLWPGYEGFEQFFKQHSISYYPAEANMFDVISDCELIMINSLSSVNMEAVLSGRFVVNLLDGFCSKRDHEENFGTLPNLRILSINEAAELLDDFYSGNFVPPQGKDILMPFDFELAVKSITQD